MKFVSRKDLWLSIVIWSCVIACIVLGLSPLFVGGAGIVGGTVLFVVCTATAGFITWLWIWTYYVLTENGLIIRSGPITKTIPYESITKAKPVRSWMSSAALSSRRVEISFGRYDMIHISPLDEYIFLAELQKRCPHLLVERSGFENV